MFNFNIGISSSSVPVSQRLLAEARGYALMQEEEKAKKLYVEVIEKAKGELDKNPSIQGKKAFNELRAEHFNFLEKVRQKSLAQEKGKLVNYLFEKALSRLSSLEVSNKPSLFLVYAHENKAHGKAEAGTSKYLIEKLTQIQVVLYSDQTPIGQPYSSAAAALKKDGKLEDILTNQLCLLPGQLRSDVKPVDKVVVCCSDVLGSYLKWREYDNFYQKLKEAYGKDREACLKGGEQGNAWAIREVVREFSQEEKYKAGFHHVLTEMAFLQIRAEQMKGGHGIIPVPLTRNSYDGCLSRFISATTVRMEDIPRFEEQAQVGQVVYPNQSRHWVLFKLIERLLVGSDEAKTFLDKFWQGYSECISWLKEASRLDGFEFIKRVDGIFDEIERALHKQLASTVQQVYPAWQQVDTRLLDQSCDLAQIQTGIDSLVARLLGNLQENIQKLRLNYLEGLEKDREIKDALANYVSLEVTPLHDSTRFDLENKVQDFLSSDKKVLLLVGEAGSGKSTFNRHLAAGLWEAYVQASAVQNSPIPVFIQLSSLPESNRNLVEAFFETQGFSKEQIKELQSAHSFVLILDGFDEIKDRQRNFYKDNHLDCWKDAKIIISSRPEYLGSNYQYKFHPSGERAALQEYQLAPFSGETIEEYVDQYKKVHPEGPWSAEQYKEALKQRDLKELVGNPFLLKIALSVLPELSEKLRVAAQRFTRIALYDQFVKSWFERSQERLAQIGLSENEKEAFEVLHDEGFAEHGIGFSKDLALEMYHAGEVLVTYSPTGYSSRQRLNIAPEQDWHKRFLSNEDIQIKLKRLNAPVIYQDKQNGLGKEYRFIHKSLQDYFVARALWEETDAHDEIEPSSWLNTLNIVNDPAVLQFLAEWVQQEPKLENQLLGVIKQSKGEEGAQFEQGAANAITALVKAGVQFNGSDLKGIRIPGADLSYGIFDLVHLQGADLTGVKLQGAWLRGANFTEAEMAEVEFGEGLCLEMSGPVKTCCYSPDGRWLAVGSGHDIHLYELSRLHLISTTDKDHDQDSVNSIEISSDGKWLASGSRDKIVRLWRIEEGKICFADTGIGHEGMVFSIAMSSDGKWLASGGRDKTVRLWRIEENKLHLADTDTIILHEGYWLHIAISSNGQWLAASGGGNNKLRLWRIEEGKLHLMDRDKIHQDASISVAFSSDNKWLASGSYGGKVELWSIEGEKFSLVHTYKGHQDAVSSLAFSSDGQWLASGSYDGKVKLWSLKGERTLVHVYQGHGDLVSSVTFSPDSSQLASSSWDRTVKFWILGEGDRVSNTNESHEGNVSSIECSSDGNLLISGGQDSTIKVWCVKESQQGLIGTYKEHNTWVSSVAMSLDGEWLISGGTNMVQLWRIEEGKLCLTDSHIGHEEVVWSVAISSNGKWLASGSRDKTVKLWQMEKGRLRLVDIGTEHQDQVMSVAISLDGNFLASGSYDKTVKLWCIEEGRLNLMNTCIEHQGSVHSVAFSPDGEWLTSGSGDGTVKLWSAATGKLVHTYTGHKGPVMGVKVSPDRKWIASIGWEKTMKLWSLTEPKICHTTLEGWEIDLRALAWQTSAENFIKLVLVGGPSIYSFRLDKSKEGWKDRLEWISHQSVLGAFGAKIDKGLNLSEINTQLLIQKGANQVFIQGLENQMHQCQKRLQEVMNENPVSIFPSSNNEAQGIVDIMNYCVNGMDQCVDEIQKDKWLRGSVYSSSLIDWADEFEQRFKMFEQAADLLKKLKNGYGDFNSIQEKLMILLPEDVKPALMEA